MQFPNERELKSLRERYPAGTLIRLIHMNDPLRTCAAGELWARLLSLMTQAICTCAGGTAEASPL